MASLLERVPQNVSGKYYVDASCIDCDQCRALAPEFFGRTEDGLSYVTRQPQSADEIADFEEALNCCAVASIGSDGN
jgi:ferredoxin